MQSSQQTASLRLLPMLLHRVRIQVEPPAQSLAVPRQICQTQTQRGDCRDRRSKHPDPQDWQVREAAFEGGSFQAEPCEFPSSTGRYSTSALAGLQVLPR